jgi:hypothetical protein
MPLRKIVKGRIGMSIWMTSGFGRGAKKSVSIMLKTGQFWIKMGSFFRDFTPVTFALRFPTFRAFLRRPHAGIPGLVSVARPIASQDDNSPQKAKKRYIFAKNKAL